METFNIDKFISRSESNISYEEAAKMDFVFICLPTPVNEAGDYFTGDIETVIVTLMQCVKGKKPVIVLRSTVAPGFCNYMRQEYDVTNIVFNPEFLSEDTWKQDANRPMLVVVGAENPKLREKVAGLYRGRFKYNEPIVTDTITAEMIKLSLNAFFTTKVAFANIIYSYAQKKGANYETIKSVLENHPWGSKGHFKVFHKGGRGAGGKCLEKDIAALNREFSNEVLMAVKMWNQYLLQKYPKNA